MHLLQRVAAALALAVMAVLASGCSAPASLLLYAVEKTASTEKDPVCLTPGCAATAMLQHAYDKLTEGDPTPCARLTTVARALTPRCGAYRPGSLLAKDVVASGLPVCPLSLAAREPANWPMLPELLAKGALPEACVQAPIAALAEAQPCPAFLAATPESLKALRWLAEADPRAVQHDVVRLLSCPTARAAGLDTLLDGWLAQGRLPADGLGFSVLGALHPNALPSPLSQALEARGHRAATATNAPAGSQPGGFDLALRSADRVALDWWFTRLPAWVNRVPPARPGQLAWLPLARVITPGYLADAGEQAGLVAFLLGRGADPWQRLPHEPAQSVVSLARTLNSPALAALDTPLVYPVPGSERTVALAPGSDRAALPVGR